MMKTSQYFLTITRHDGSVKSASSNTRSLVHYLAQGASRNDLVASVQVVRRVSGAVKSTTVYRDGKRVQQPTEGAL